jgi:hypothetical protein
MILQAGAARGRDTLAFHPYRDGNKVRRVEAEARDSKREIKRRTGLDESPVAKDVGVHTAEHLRTNERGEKEYRRDGQRMQGGGGGTGGRRGGGGIVAVWMRTGWRVACTHDWQYGRLRLHNDGLPSHQGWRASTLLWRHALRSNPSRHTQERTVAQLPPNMDPLQAGS